MISRVPKTVHLDEETAKLILRDADLLTGISKELDRSLDTLRAAVKEAEDNRHQPWQEWKR